MPYYSGSESDLLREKGKNYLTISLQDEAGQKINEDLKVLLIKVVPLIEHPNEIEGLYIATQNSVMQEV